MPHPCGFPQLGEDRLPVCFADVRHIRLVKELRGEGGRLHRDGLRARSLFARDVRGGHGPFFNGKERLACLAIKQVDVARFGDLSNGVNLLSAA